MDQSVSDSDLTTSNGGLRKKSLMCRRARKKARRNKKQVVFDPNLQIRLENLTISDNQLTSIPGVLRTYKFPRLRFVDISRNPVKGKTTKK